MIEQNEPSVTSTTRIDDATSIRALFMEPLLKAARVLLWPIRSFSEVDRHPSMVRHVWFMVYTCVFVSIIIICSILLPILVMYSVAYPHEPRPSIFQLGAIELLSPIAILMNLITIVTIVIGSVICNGEARRDVQNRAILSVSFWMLVAITSLCTWISYGLFNVFLPPASFSTHLLLWYCVGVVVSALCQITWCVVAVVVGKKSGTSTCNVSA
jgi:hypothetical protein